METRFDAPDEYVLAACVAISGMFGIRSLATFVFKGSAAIVLFCPLFFWEVRLGGGVDA